MLETLSARGEARGSRNLALPSPMFEEPEWAEEAPVVADLGSVALGLRPTAVSQIKVSGPAGVLRTDSAGFRIWGAPCV